MRDEDDEGGKKKWKIDALENRKTAYEALTEATQRHISNRNPINVPQEVVVLHAYTLNYADAIRPKKKELPKREFELGNGETVRENMWNAVIDSVSVPESGEYSAGITDMYGEYTREDLWQQIPWTEKPVSPATLNREWRDNEIDIRIKINDKHRGKTTEHIQEPVYLPPSTCSLLLNYLDECFNELNWLPEAGKPEDAFDEPPEPPEHVKEEAPAYQK